MVDAQLIEAFRRDGAVCVRGAFSADEVALVASGHRAQPRRAERRARSSRAARTTPAASSRTSATGSGSPSSSGSSASRRPRQIAGELMGADAGAALPRPRARQGAGHAPADAVAPGPAVLQRRRLADLLSVWMPVDPVDARVDARVRGRLASRPVAHAADVHGRRGEVVPGGQPRGPARHRGRPRRPSRSSAGSSSRATPSSSTC